MYRRAFVAFFFLLFLFNFKAVFASDISRGFADLAEKLVPAVVNISTEHVAKESAKKRGGMKFFNKGSLFEEFRDFFEKMEPFMERQPESERDYISLGSGFIIDKSGIIVTNSHVVQDAKEVTVTLSNNNQYKAIVLGRDDKMDLAVLKIDTEEKLSYVIFGDSDKVRVGEWVVAIGNPFGLGGSVSVGIVSARARDINLGSLNEFIQTDAAINRGNSGGPLFNTDGEVIGINTAIFSPSGGNVGIGFAIPSNSVKDLIGALSKGQKVKHGWIGVKVQAITPEIAESLKLPGTAGALIAEVSKNGPADKSGLKVGDVILSFGGEKVNTMSRLPSIVAKSKIDRYVDVEVYRGGQSIIKTLKIESLDSMSSDPNGDGASYRSESLGVVVSESDNNSNSPKQSCSGVKISDLDMRSDFASKGVKVGDTISAVNQSKVDNVAKFKAEIESVIASGAKTVLLLVCRGDNSIFMAVRLQDR